jgi:hypothetical protein
MQRAAHQSQVLHHQQKVSDLPIKSDKGCVMADEACSASVGLDGLPGPALQLVDQFVGRSYPQAKRTSLLRTCRTLRDTVLAGSKSIGLQLFNETPSDMAAHYQLLRRACAAAAPGLKVSLAAAQSGASVDRQLLHSLLEPVPEVGFPNVHALVLEVSRSGFRCMFLSACKACTRLVHDPQTSPHSCC